MSDPAVRVAVRPDRVAVLTIDQPGATVNVLTVALWDELEAALDALPPDLAGLVIASGKPGCFIAGADLHLLANATPGDPAVKAFITQGLRVLAKLEALPFPTCAAIDGVALGGGLELALACDWRIVGTHQKVELGLPEVNLGLIPGWGGTQRLPRLIGVSAAITMLVSGIPVAPMEAEYLELIATTVKTEELIETATNIAKKDPDGRWELVRGVKFEPSPSWPPEPTVALASKAACEADRVVRLAAPFTLAAAIPIETEAFLRLAGSAESRARIAAFFAARKR